MLTVVFVIPYVNPSHFNPMKQSGFQKDYKHLMQFVKKKNTIVRSRLLWQM